MLSTTPYRPFAVAAPAPGWHLWVLGVAGIAVLAGGAALALRSSARGRGPTSELVAEERDEPVAKKVEAFMSAPVTRREFEQEIDRLWSFIDPSYGRSPEAPRLSVRTKARLGRPLHDQVKTAWNAITRGRRLPPGLRQDAVEYAERMIVLRDRIRQLNAIPGVKEAAVRLKMGNAPLRTPADVLAYARELVAVQRKLGDLRAPVWGEDARRKWL